MPSDDSLLGEVEDDGWFSVSRAASLVGMPKRTIYAHIERGDLPTRDVDGVSHIRLDALHGVAVQRRSAGANGAVALHSAAAAHPASASPAVSDARTRVELHKLAAEELRAADHVREARDEVAVAEALRAAKRVREELAAERERMELEQLAWRHQHERAEAERAARRKAQLHEAQRERERAEAEAAATRRAEAEEFLRWAREVEDDVVWWVRGEFGADAISATRDAVKTALIGLTRAVGPAELERLVQPELDLALATFADRRTRAQVELSRQKLVTDVMFRYVVHAPEGDVPRIRVAAEREAALVHPSDADARQRIRDAAKAEHDTILRERDAEQQAEEWADAYGRIPLLVSGVLPKSATPEERAHAVQELQRFIAARPPELRAWRFEHIAADLLTPIADAVNTRLRGST